MECLKYQKNFGTHRFNHIYCSFNFLSFPEIQGPICDMLMDQTPRANRTAECWDMKSEVFPPNPPFPDGSRIHSMESACITCCDTGDNCHKMPLKKKCRKYPMINYDQLWLTNMESAISCFKTWTWIEKLKMRILQNFVHTNIKKIGVFFANCKFSPVVQNLSTHVQ